ncbi:MAG: bleomycin resistance family protein [Gemmatimonadetes bacterium]|jgi:predicted lactoylglutathione lyase|nr:bleomycin resistance family protein [Gemmatimonadota bacterium]
MAYELPAAIPEIPVAELGTALAYYRHQLGFTHDWGGESGGGIAGISQGDCRLFLADRAFRERRYGNVAPVLVWLNLSGRPQVDDLHDQWRRSGATIISPPEAKPWKLYEFTAADLDGNLLRVFYDFAWETRGN